MPEPTPNLSSSLYKETSDDTFNYGTDWKEIVEQSTMPSSMSVSNDTQEATLVGRIPGNMARSAAAFFLQWAYCDTASPWRLHRHNPHRHPVLPWLYAYDVSFTPFIAEANSAESNAIFTRSVFDTATKYTNTKYLICSVRYKPFRYKFLESVAANTSEYRRNCVFDVEPSVEAISVTGGMSQLKFAETDTGGPTVGTPFTAPLAVLLAKANLTVTWYNVPLAYLSTETNFFWPTKIMDRVGTVNSAQLFSFFDAGTMLMNPPRFLIKPQPVAGSAWRYPSFVADVVLNWQYFNPEKGKAASGYKGHNLMPWSGTGETGGDGKFYLATRDGTTSGAQLLRSTDHTKVFEHVSQ